MWNKVVVVVCCVATICTPAIAQEYGPVERTVVQDGYVYQIRRWGKGSSQMVWRPTDYKWTEQPWTDNDVPYRRILEQTQDPAVSSASLLKQMSEVRASLTGDSPPLERFRFACLVDAAAGRNLIKGNSYPNEREAAVAFLSLPPQPATPTSHRLRLLLEMKAYPSPYLLPAAARLLQRDPDDYEVRLRYAKALSLSTQQQRREQAVQVLRAMRKQHPDKANTLTYLGGALWSLARLDNQKETLLQSLACYEQFLKEAPADDPFRPQAPVIMGVIKGYIEKLEKNG